MNVIFSAALCDLVIEQAVCARLIATAVVPGAGLGSTDRFLSDIHETGHQGQAWERLLVDHLVCESGVTTDASCGSSMPGAVWLITALGGAFAEVRRWP